MALGILMHEVCRIANYDVFAHIGHSNDWHAVDSESDNADDVWGFLAR